MNMGCFHSLAIVNNVAINIGVHVWVPVFHYFVYIPNREMVKSYGILCLTSWETARLFSKMGALFYTLSQQYTRVAGLNYEVIGVSVP